MGFLSPGSDAQGAYRAIAAAGKQYQAWQEAAARAQAAGKMPPPAPPHPDDVAAQFRDQQRDIGASATEGFSGQIGNPDAIEAPWGDDSNFRRRQHMANSMANDALLGTLLGSKRGRTNEDGPEGTYAMTDYPGLKHAIDTAASGVDVRGGLMTPESVEERKRWAAEQARRLGMDRRIGSDEWKNYRRGTQGMGAKQRRQAFKGFLRG